MVAPSRPSPTNGQGAPQSVENEINERTALMVTSSETSIPHDGAPDISINDHDRAGENSKPLPMAQIFFLCAARLIEPIAFFSIFPYINKMCQENGSLDDADVGFYSGLIESLFSLTQMLVMVPWGTAADRLGRKPVLIFSMAGLTIATSMFGMATTIWEMIFFRCLAGVFAGTVVTIRTMISEHSTVKTQARAFSLFAFAGNLGILFGPLVGGVLAEPAVQYPRLFHNVPFFERYPYALSSLAVGAISLVITAACAFNISETLPSKTAAQHNSQGEAAITSETPVGLKKPAMSIRELVKAPGVGLVLYTYQHIMLLAFAYTAVIPLFWYTPIALGGLNLSPLQISMFMAFNGLAQAVWLLLVLPPLQNRIGTTGVLRACATAYPIFLSIPPALNLLRCNGSPAATTVFWICAPVLMGLGCGVAMSFTAIQLALNDVAPNPHILGTLNALCLALTSGVRSFSPALFASLFALEARNQWLWGYAVWLLLIFIAFGFTVVSRQMPDYDELRREKERKHSTSEASLN
ncbi:Efflux pump azaK [Drechslerella dactyloides]|uniref:Efflux pump azaK n=1 Tax=Drechslerella dactyloides TaxID=74499 RepID=A0AAD6ISP9_DREDA|nr:Efflux pump azaK [Drechslerella dactyloides]